VKHARPTVLLFDIDGTLVLTGGAGRRAMVGAFVQVHARGDVFEGLNFGGMTDRAIVRHGLRRVREPREERDEEEAIDLLLEAYLGLLESELERTEDYRILPGVEALLISLRGLSRVAVGLGTGNVRRGAIAKLARGRIHEEFAFGGFGCDAEDRALLLRAGATRGASSIGARLEECDVVVIGDTPKDVHAARGIGARCVGVGTGSYTAADLIACGAAVAFATLAEPDARAAILGT
jgi:phosphoglycolate phosphatase-like HAD superfamily hydrolase